MIFTPSFHACSVQVESEQALHFGAATLYFHKFLMFNRFILLFYQENILLYLF
jgi:hypothetical protein